MLCKCYCVRNRMACGGAIARFLRMVLLAFVSCVSDMAAVRVSWWLDIPPC